MSRRRVSVKDLGEADCQGWLQRRKDGRSFLGGKWKRFWFVLKKSSLYWYGDKMAEKAEGFINLCSFSIEQATGCRKKHVITATHPNVVTIFIAADSYTDMNKWISKLREAAGCNEVINAEDCYSEDSDQDTAESASASFSPDSELNQTEPEASAEDVPPLGQSLSCSSMPAITMTSDNRTRTCSAGSPLRRTTRTEPSSGRQLSGLDLPTSGDSSQTARIPELWVTEKGEERPSDELESLYKHLKATRLSLIGQRDFRASFIRRSRNEQINEKLHQLRILSSTLKAKESELQVVEQILDHPALPAPTYRQWKLSNLVLLEEILQHSQAAGVATELSAETADESCGEKSG
ncbi:hypothetical protein CRENBAI_004135 [Crenichthys baileyi]|uniref:PH domain-containing protein n=1 Tax=Crenichthys baileyi TaxID=28760 RepID=A0AAV9QNF7_9TELE